MATEIGTLAHRTVGEAIVRGATTPAQIDALVAALVAEHDDPYLRRRGQKQRIGTAARSYIWWFDLRRTHLLMHREYALSSSVADLVWQDRLTGAVLLDEVKTGLTQPAQQDGSQTSRHLAGGRAAFGGDLVGVRVLTLSRPSAARLHRANGRVEHLPPHVQGGLS